MPDFTTDTPLKQCSKCDEWKPATPQYFHRRKSQRDGLRSICITCRGCKKRPDYSASEGNKQCRSCRTEKPATTDFFYATKSNKDGLGSSCKSCMDAKKKQWNLDNANRWKESLRVYRVTNKEYIRERDKKLRAKNAERLKAKRREKRIQNLEDIKRKRLEQASRYKAWMKAWRQRNKDHEREYYERNKDAARIRSRTYETRKLNLPSTFTTDDWQNALAYFNGCCAVCGRPPGLFHTLAMDHWIPVSSSGCPGTVKTNIVPLCHGQDGCNNSKSNSHPEAWVVSTFGKTKGRKIISNITRYFESLKA